MSLTLFEQREFASAVFSYWSAKEESINIGRLKFSKATKLMNLDDASLSVTKKTHEMRRLAANEKVQNALFVEKDNISENCKIKIYNNRLKTEYAHRQGDRFGCETMCFRILQNICSLHQQVISQNFLYEGEVLEIVNKDGLIQSEDIQAFLRKASNYYDFVRRISDNWSCERAGTYNSRFTSPSIRAGETPTVEQIMEAQIDCYLDGTIDRWTCDKLPITFSIKGKVPKSVKKFKDLSKIIPRKIT
jgi:hypothetical protein